MVIAGMAPAALRRRHRIATAGRRLAHRRPGTSRGDAATLARRGVRRGIIYRRSRRA
ncbi:MAG: hypothetical protein ACK4GO_00760 [Gemmobacter sp.]